MRFLKGGDKLMINNLPVMLLKKIVLLPFQDVRLDLNNDNPI